MELSLSNLFDSEFRFARRRTLDDLTIVSCPLPRTRRDAFLIGYDLTIEGEENPRLRSLSSFPPLPLQSPCASLLLSLVAVSSFCPRYLPSDFFLSSWTRCS